MYFEHEFPNPRVSRIGGLAMSRTTDDRKKRRVKKKEILSLGTQRKKFNQDTKPRGLM